MNKKSILFLLIFSLNLQSQESEEKKAFAGQRPEIAYINPLYSFGQTILPKNSLLTACYFFQLDAKNNIHNTTIMPSATYGLTDRCALTTYIPYIWQEQDNVTTRGLDDIQAQAEYAFYQHFYDDALAQATIVFDLFLPTGNPILTRSTTNIFLGYTFSHLSRYWYFFSSNGVQFSARRKNVRFGNYLFYEFGFGVVPIKKGTFSICSFVEFTGLYVPHDRINGVTDPTTGNNAITIGPVIQIASKNLIMLLGFQYPLVSNFPEFSTGTRATQLQPLFNLGFSLLYTVQF